MSAVWLRTTVLTFAAALACSIPAMAQSFQNNSYSSPNGPTDVFAADLNHDGHADIVTTEFSADMVTVFLNHGNGTFTSGGSATYLTAPSPRNVIIADLNGDGNPDIVTASCPSGTGQAFASVLFGRGDGTFANHVDYPLAQCTFSLGTIVVGTDKLPSLIIAEGTRMQLLRNNGAGVFTVHDIGYTGSDIFLYASGGDYNHDGIRDIAFVEQNRPLNQNRLLIMDGRADGSFAAPRVIFSSTASGGIYMDQIQTVDVNGDGIADLLTSFNLGGTHGGVLAFVNSGTGTFTRHTLSLANEEFVTGRIIEGDFRGIGQHDIISGSVLFVNGTAKYSVVIFPATSKTTWGTAKRIAEPEGPNSLVRGSFNTDTKLDMAFTTGLPDTLHIFLNNTCTVPSTAGVSVCSPKAGTTVSSPVHVSASASGGSVRISAMKAYIDGVQVASSTNDTLDGSVAKSSGSHRLTVNAWDTNGKLYQASFTFSVK